VSEGEQASNRYSDALGTAGTNGDGHRRLRTCSYSTLANPDEPLERD
jgi:hypothetical protein